MKQFARRLPTPSPLRMTRVLQAAGLTLTAASVLSLGGCASSTDASLIHLPDGQSGYAINCSGADASTTWASCYVLANSGHSAEALQNIDLLNADARRLGVPSLENESLQVKKALLKIRLSAGV